MSNDVYVCKLGIVGLGGCGTSQIRRIMRSLDPDHYKDLYLFAGNTDAQSQNLYFDNITEPNHKKWVDGNRFTAHRLGGVEVTKGRGAGAKPEVGKQAAETAESTEAFTTFFNQVDEIFVVTGVGGGTGGGASPVAIKLAKEMGKSIIAIVVTPDPLEGRTTRATTALREIQALVPTYTINNGYLKEYMASLGEEGKDLTLKQEFNLVDENSVFKLLQIGREILQVPGDVLNIDEADYQTVYSCGHYPFFGLAEIELENQKITSAEPIAADLFAGRFQDTGIINQGKVAMMWFHGPWFKSKMDEILSIARQRISENNPNTEEVEIFVGAVDENASDGKLWVAIKIVAQELAPQSKIIPIQKPTVVKGLLHESKKLLTPTPAVRPEAMVGVIRFSVNGKWVEPSVNANLASRFNTLYSNRSSTREDLEAIYNEVKAATELLPDMPERFTEKKVEAKKLWFRWPEKGLLAGSIED